jgi:translation initiation factor 2 alpha subunit (eIF-2alpha)
VAGKKFFGKPVRNNVGKTNRGVAKSVGGFKRIRRVSHPCNRVPHHQRRKCFRKYKAKKAVKMIAKKAKVSFKQAKQIGKTNRGGIRRGNLPPGLLEQIKLAKKGARRL